MRKWRGGVLVVAAGEPGGDGAGVGAPAVVAPCRLAAGADGVPGTADVVALEAAVAVRRLGEPPTRPDGHATASAARSLPPPTLLRPAISFRRAQPVGAVRSLPPPTLPLHTAATKAPPRHRFAFALVLAAFFGLGMAVAHARSTNTRTSAAPSATTIEPGPATPEAGSEPTNPAGSSSGGTLTDDNAAPGDDGANAASTEVAVPSDPATVTAGTATPPAAPPVTHTAVPPTTRPPGAPWTLTLTGRMTFPYLTLFITEEYHVVSTLTLTGDCDGRGPCAIVPLFPGRPYEGQPATYALTKAGDGYTLSARFDHVEPGAQCAPISVRLELSALVVNGPDGPGLIGSGQYVPDRRSTPLPDGSLGCTTDVGVFSFASQGLTPPPAPKPAPPPPQS